LCGEDSSRTRHRKRPALRLAVSFRPGVHHQAAHGLEPAAVVLCTREVLAAGCGSAPRRQGAAAQFCEKALGLAQATTVLLGTLLCFLTSAPEVLALAPALLQLPVRLLPVLLPSPALGFQSLVHLRELCSPLLRFEEAQAQALVRASSTLLGLCTREAPFQRCILHL